MNRAETTNLLSKKLEEKLNPYFENRRYIAKEVTFDYSTEHSIRVDYMRIVPKNNTVSGIEKSDVYCYEIKSCVEDFKSKNGHNFIGDFNYYVMPCDVYKKIIDYLPRFIGVYTLNKEGFLQLEKSAKRRDRARPVSEILLMMFRSVNRELMKFLKKERE